MEILSQGGAPEIVFRNEIRILKAAIFEMDLSKNPVPQAQTTGKKLDSFVSKLSERPKTEFSNLAAAHSNIARMPITPQTYASPAEPSAVCFPPTSQNSH
ncbi:MAG: hypothetical protein ACR2O3_14905 [Rhizobiaceae bacterium]